ncbi:MAG: M23 family metallopeptidase [Candidatus Krumholzibacteriota bacterium]|nr:M23 family metallopeptidase [Candidatus Krumholzibacteriota bacterium]
MKKDTFSVIIVPHDVNKTRTYKVPYSLLYVMLTFLIIGTVSLVIFIATYGRLLVKTRETILLEKQVAELTRRNEKINELMRNLAQIHAMDLKVRQMLGLDIDRADSLAMQSTGALEDQTDREVQNEKAQMLRAIPSFWPVRGFITKGFSIAGGEKDPNFHPGIDIGVERGVPVKAAASGYVLEASWNDIYGYFVRIDHGYGIKTLYGHNERLVVIRGERVGRGQTIAFSGNTGRSSAPHLHFEVTLNNNYVDPLKYLLQ